jgi:B12 binding domain/Radical SAM superfamily
MKLVLVNPPHTFIDRSEIGPPLGLLRLAAAATQSGTETEIIHLNLLIHPLPELMANDDFYDQAALDIAGHNADIVGITSMAVDSHVALEIARRLKERQPGVRVVLGGTHFTVIATEIIKTYPWIDYVIAGEGETAIQKLVRTNPAPQSILRGTPLHSMDGIGLPLDLLNSSQYFDVNPNRSLDFETGRGCRYRCSFCYSPGHYGGFRNFEIRESLAELTTACSYGFKSFFFVEDNFLNDGSRALRFFEELCELQLDMTWAAYVTFPELTAQYISAMAQAGCVALFAGIDAVGRASRREYKKAFVRDEQVMVDRIRRCVDHGITPTCAFLLTPPSMAGGQNLLETLRLALTARTSGARVRLNTLTIYNNTGIAENLRQCFFDPVKTKLMLDVPLAVEENPYAVSRPDLFPYHARYVGKLEWQDFLALAHCLYTLFEVYPHSLQHAWDESGVPPTEIASSVLDNIGSLLDIPKVARRESELLASIDVFEQLAIGKRDFSYVLNTESAAVLQYV